MDPTSLPIIENYTSERIPNPYPHGELPWQVYHTVRNAVFRVSKAFGRVGPMGECPITEDSTPSLDSWPPADKSGPLDFFLVDDQYNDERYIYVEIEHAEACTSGWLGGLMDSLKPFEGWGVGIVSLSGGYVLVFEDRLLVTGNLFETCRTLDDVVQAIKTGIRESD